MTASDPIPSGPIVVWFAAFADWGTFAVIASWVKWAGESR